MNDQPQRVKFTTRIDSALLSDLRALAKKKNCQLQSLVDEAVRGFLERRHKQKVMDAYRESVERFGPVYEKLAK